MKKTFVALAALAAVGAASAQVSLTGAYAFGYESKAAAGAARNAGLGTDTAAIKLTAVEDLGNGMSATAVVSAGGLVRQSAVGGEDASLTLAGGFGSVALRTIESAGLGLTARASGGAPGYDLHGEVFGANANIDQVKYTAPAIGGLTLGVGYVDRGAGTNGAGLAAGSTGAASAQPSFGVEAGYKVGGLDALIDFTSWTRKGDALVTSNTNSTRVRVSASYDLGSVKVGAGFASTDKTGTAGTTNETLVGFSVPMGAAKFGATYGQQDNKGGTKKQGYTLGLDYALSKSVNVGAAYKSWTTDGVAGDNNAFRVLVGKSF